MFCTDLTPPYPFTWSNLTIYQKRTIQEKHYIYNYVESSIKSKQECFRELSAELGKGFNAIKLIYYNTKNEPNEPTTTKTG